MAFAFPQPEPSGRTPLKADGLAKAFGHNVVFVDVDVDIDRGERLIIMGLNGAGKTTLLRILAGVETADLGEVELGHKASLGYYAQEHEQITSGETVLRSHAGGLRTSPTATCAALLATSCSPTRSIRTPARSRAVRRPSWRWRSSWWARHNVLLLDEPTNNLDPQAKEALLDALVSTRAR